MVSQVALNRFFLLRSSILYRAVFRRADLIFETAVQRRTGVRSSTLQLSGLHMESDYGSRHEGRETIFCRPQVQILYKT